jgi:hypothetical protein
VAVELGLRPGAFGWGHWTDWGHKAATGSKVQSSYLRQQPAGSSIVICVWNVVQPTVNTWSTLCCCLPPAGMKVLDCGCGVGGPMRTIASVSGAHVTGGCVVTAHQHAAQQHAEAAGQQQETVLVAAQMCAQGCSCTDAYKCIPSHTHAAIDPSPSPSPPPSLYPPFFRHHHQPVPGGQGHPPQHTPGCGPTG